MKKKKEKKKTQNGHNSKWNCKYISKQVRIYKSTSNTKQDLDMTTL